VRLPRFGGYCPHIKDQIIRLNGGTFNVTHYLRVLYAKAQLDPTVLRGSTIHPVHKEPS